jgi:iron complex outermembrane recepter protein
VLNNKLKFMLLLATYSGVLIGAEPNAEPVNNKSKAAEPNATIQLDEIEIKAKRRRIITPLPGLPIDRETATTNIQSATDKEISESKATNVTEFMNSNMQSVNVTDYTGNPFQQDLNYRGFTASPQIGTPQGISVYMDGVRVNESFGEVVNWDLIPMNAIASLNLIPGSNPMFGLNTIGGALTISTKDGFTDHFLRAQYLTGSWGRDQVQFSNGMHTDRFALFTAYTHFDENGWRANSPSNVRQLFNKASIRLDSGEINLTALNVDTALIGNGLLPTEMADFDRKQVFSSPDEAKNGLDHYSINGSWYINDRVSVSGLAYRRNLRQKAIGADVYTGLKDFYGRNENTNDLDGDGCFDNDLNCDGVIIDDVLASMNATINLSNLKSRSDGYSFQMTYEGDKHQLAFGFTRDKTDINFIQSQILGALDAQNYAGLTSFPDYFQDANFSIVTSGAGWVRNRLTGNSDTKALFFNDVWSPTDTLHVSYGARMSWSNVKNFLISDKGLDFYQLTDSLLNGTSLVNGVRLPRLRCENSRADTSALLVCSKGDYDYRSFNPSIGVSWEAKENLTVYGNLSRGSRVPSVLELGCAKDDSGREGESTNFQYGCSIPTALSSDPYLKQVRSTGYELGLRGGESTLEWNLGGFVTNLKDDILFVPLGRKNRGVFDNFGKTRREGIEMGIKSAYGKSTFGLNYTWMRATFESPAQLINDANSSNTQATTTQAFVSVEPGDQIPGMPNHIIQANWNYKFTPDFDATLSMVAHSSSYVRGNENNEHQPRSANNVDLNNDGVVDTDRYDYTGRGIIGGYAVFNLRANYRIKNGVNLFVRVDNLFDKEYSTAGNIGRNPFTPSGVFKFDPASVDGGWTNSTFISPGAPRSAWVGINIDWDLDSVRKSQSLKELSE